MKSTPLTSYGDRGVRRKGQIPMGRTRSLNRVEHGVFFPIALFDELVAEWEASNYPYSFSSYIVDLIKKGRQQ